MKARTAQHGFLPLHSEGDFGHPCPIFLSGKGGQGYPSLYPHFCIALLGDRPEILSGRPLSNYNKAMSHERAEPHNMGFYLFIRETLDFWTPLPYFPLRENWAGCPNPLPRFLHSLVRGSSLRFSRDVPIVTTTRLCLMRRQNHTTWVSTSSFRRLWTPCPIFLSGKVGGPKIPPTPISA